MGNCAREEETIKKKKTKKVRLANNKNGKLTRWVPEHNWQSRKKNQGLEYKTIEILQQNVR